jgi:hypothetical protein
MTNAIYYQTIFKHTPAKNFSFEYKNFIMLEQKIIILGMSVKKKAKAKIVK